MVELRWKLADYLGERGLTAYRLVKAAPRANANAVYRMAKKGEEPTRVDLPTLEAVLQGLRDLTGEPVTLADLIETAERSGYREAVLRDAKPFRWADVEPFVDTEPDEVEVTGFWAQHDAEGRRVTAELAERDDREREALERWEDAAR